MSVNCYFISLDLIIFFCIYYSKNLNRAKSIFSATDKSHACFEWNSKEKLVCCCIVESPLIWLCSVSSSFGFIFLLFCFNIIILFNKNFCSYLLKHSLLCPGQGNSHDWITIEKRNWLKLRSSSIVFCADALSSSHSWEMLVAICFIDYCLWYTF